MEGYLQNCLRDHLFWLNAIFLYFPSQVITGEGIFISGLSSYEEKKRFQYVLEDTIRYPVCALHKAARFGTEGRVGSGLPGYGFAPCSTGSS